MRRTLSKKINSRADRLGELPVPIGTDLRSASAISGVGATTGLGAIAVTRRLSEDRAERCPSWPALRFTTLVPRERRDSVRQNTWLFTSDRFFGSRRHCRGIRPQIDFLWAGLGLHSATFRPCPGRSARRWLSAPRRHQPSPRIQTLAPFRCPGRLRCLRGQPPQIPQRGFERRLQLRRS